MSYICYGTVTVGYIITIKLLSCASISGMRNLALIPIEKVERKIYLIRGKKVMLDRDLAELYKVKSIALRQQVKRNKERFPDDFIFQLTDEEVESMISQNVIPSKQALGGHFPYAFTHYTLQGQIFSKASATSVRTSLSLSPNNLVNFGIAGADSGLIFAKSNAVFPRTLASG